MHYQDIREHFDVMAADYDKWKKKAWYYYAQLKQLCQKFVPSGKRVLEIGCGTGDILAALQPKVGVGIDISGEMIKRARRKHPGFIFKRQNVEELSLKQKFDYVVLVDIVDHLPDIFTMLVKIREVCSSKTRLVLTTINPVWEPVLDLAERLGQKMPEGPHNWVPHDDLKNILELAGFKVIKNGFKVLVPKYVPKLSDYLNKNFNRWEELNQFGAVQYFVCQKLPERKVNRSLTCSVIIPAFNEAGNIRLCIARVPQMGRQTEIVVVDDGSKDNTVKIVEQIKQFDRRVKLIRLPKNLGKVWAVKAGFDTARGDIIMILDADMAVPPEELVLFYRLIADESAEFVNGTRMIYPMEQQAMRQLNLWGNKIFGAIFSWILGQRVTDTLCGTKALLKKDYKKINLGSEPWGDFDLLFGAARLKLKIREFPVHYKRRQAGESKMRLFRHGLRLALMCVKGIYELKWPTKLRLLS